VRHTLFLLAALLAAACARAPGPPAGAWAPAQPGECGVADVALDERPVAAPGTAASRPAPLPAADAPAPLALRLNVPAYRLDVLEDGRVTRTITVAVGTPDHPTPIGAFAITKIVWNPWWVPPPFEWAKKERVTPPGPNNPTGRVKLYFGWYLFLHGTPDTASLGHAASHGCVRMANPDAIALARTLHAHASPGISPALLDSLEANPRRTQTIALETPIALDIRYDLVETRDGRTLVHEDIYRRRDAVDAGER
jgi:murein L,D-transpeptidase YcbB/YkuD